MFGIRRLLFFRSMKIAGSLHIFMDTHSIFTNGDIGGMRIDPRPAVEIVDSVLFVALVQSGVVWPQKMRAA